MRRVNLEDMIKEVEEKNMGSKFDIYLEGVLLGVSYTDGTREFKIKESDNLNWRWVHSESA
jgi:hypothetical protein